MESPSDDKKQEIISRKFDSYIRKNLKGEARSYNEAMYKRAEKEILFSEMNDVSLSRLYTLDEYDSDFTIFCALGFNIRIKNELLAEALMFLPDNIRSIILMSFFLDMSDSDIGKLQNIVRSTVFRNRKKALKEIKNYMEGYTDDKKSE